MTALGIEMTDREPTVGWEAITPPRRVSPQLADAEENLLAAWAAVDQALENEFPGEIVTDLCHQAQTAEAVYREAWQIEDRRRAALLQTKGTEP